MGNVQKFPFMLLPKECSAVRRTHCESNLIVLLRHSLVPVEVLACPDWCFQCWTFRRSQLAEVLWIGLAACAELAGHCKHSWLLTLPVSS